MERTITVRGAGSVSGKPDQIELPVTLPVRDADYETVSRRAEAALQELREALAAAGFSREELRTQDFSVNTVYESRQDERGIFRQEFAGYECRHSLRLRFDFDGDRLARALSALAGCSSGPEFSVRFTVKDPEAVKSELLAAAAVDAKSKAGALCAAAGVKLGRLLRVEYGAGSGELYSPTRLTMAEAAPAGAMLRKMNFDPEDVTASDSAVFVWEIE